MTASRKVSINGPLSMKRKTTFVLVLAFALIMAWVLIITDEQVREHLGGTLYIIGFAITGCMLLTIHDLHRRRINECSI